MPNTVIIKVIYMALDNIFIFHGQAMLMNGNDTIFTSGTHRSTVDHVGLF